MIIFHYGWLWFDRGKHQADQIFRDGVHDEWQQYMVV